MLAMSSQTSASEEIAALRHQLRSDEGILLDKYAARIDAIERGRPLFGLATLLGALVTGTGRFVPDTPGLVISVVGLTVSFLSGALVLWADYRKLELSREARTAMEIADKSLAKADAYAALLDDEIHHRRLREDRLEAGALMRDAIATAVATDMEIGEAAYMVLDLAKLRLMAAFGFEAAEYWAVTVFREDEAQARMTKIAALWNDATTSTERSRDWARGEGFTGVAWRNEAPVIVPDMESPGMADAYRVPHDKFREHDAWRYRSAASYPVIVHGAVWGIVTATTDHAQRFDSETPDGMEAARTVEDIAAHIALLATIDHD
jgi:GAF domain-containing protein